MSLKAKIEAVIYASEEPVTLAQLVGLLGNEAQAELDALAERQIELPIPELELPQLEPEPQTANEAFQVEAEPQAGPVEPVVDGSSEPAADGVGDVDVDEVRAKRLSRERTRLLNEYLRRIVDELIADYATSERGLELREVAGGFRIGTKPEYHDAVRGFVKRLKPVLKLTLQALETLAVVAYKQPVTAPEISEIRGVDSSGVLGSLMARKLITTAGRKQVIGRPILYKTTRDFLVRFGLKDVAELPSIEEFEKMAGEFAVQEEMPMAESEQELAEERITHENLLEERHSVEPQADGDSDELEPSDSNRPEDELPAVDGRLSGLPPRDYVPGDDPSADEAAIQESEAEAG